MKTYKILILLGVSLFVGMFIHAVFHPQNPIEIREVEVFVDRRIEVPTEKENYYSTCQRASTNSYMSSWNGTLKKGITPKDVESFINQCLEYYKK